MQSGKTGSSTAFSDGLQQLRRGGQEHLLTRTTVKGLESKRGRTREKGHRCGVRGPDTCGYHALCSVGRDRSETQIRRVRASIKIVHSKEDCHIGAERQDERHNAKRGQLSETSLDLKVKARNTGTDKNPPSRRTQ